MPVYPIQISRQEIQLLLWKITESVDFFNTHYAGLKVPGHITHEEKILEFLASRAAFSLVLPQVELNKTPDGKPIVEIEGHVSISHTHRWAAVGYNPDGPVGLDLEIVAEKAFRLRNKFSKEEEWTPLQKSTAFGDFVLFSVIWSVKEAVYKLLPHKGWLFKEDFFLTSLNQELQRFTVEVKKRDGEKQFVKGTFQFIENIVMVVAINDNVDKQ
jgi:phosphopantetheinyl transferase